MKLLPIPKHLQYSKFQQTVSSLSMGNIGVSGAILQSDRLSGALELLNKNNLTTHFQLNFESNTHPYILFIPSDNAKTLLEKGKSRHLFSKSLSQEGYRLKKDADGFTLIASEEKGFFYGLQTLVQILSLEKIPKSFYIEDWSDQPIRAIHLDLKGIVTRYDYILQMVRYWASYKINTLLVEYENNIPWPGHPLLEAEDHWSQQQLKQFISHCTAQYIQVIPLQQSFGHLHYILKYEEYAPLRETLEYPSDLCPSNEEGVELIISRLRQIITAHPESAYIHLGCDETLHLNSCPRCRKQFGDNGKFNNYVHHVNRMAAEVVQHGKTPIIWDDMLRKMSDEEIAHLHPNLTVAVWSYYHLDPIHLKLKEHLDRYTRLNIPKLGAACGSGADSHTGNLPNYRVRTQNLMDWGEISQNYTLTGCISTNWAKYSSIDAYCEPMPVVWHTALFAAQIFWNADVKTEDVESSILQQFWGIQNIDDSFSFQRINHGHYETTLYGDPKWLRTIANSATRHQEEALFYEFMATMNRLLTVGEHTFERLYLLTLPSAQPLEKKLVKGYILALDAQLNEIEDEAVERFAPFYTKDQTMHWLHSRLFHLRWMTDTTLASWDNTFAGPKSSN